MRRTFFEDLGKRLGETAETVSVRAGEAMEIQKLKSQIRTLERGNEDDLIELGRIMYAKFEDGESLGEEASGLCEAIQSREESIAEYRQKISDVKGDVKCGDCGKTVAKNMPYCPYCGTKMPEPAETVDGAESAKEAVENAVDAAAEAAEKAADVVGDAVEKAAEKAADVAENIGEGVEKAAEAVKEKVEEAAEKLSE